MFHYWANKKKISYDDLREEGDSTLVHGANPLKNSNYIIKPINPLWKILSQKYQMDPSQIL